MMMATAFGCFPSVGWGISAGGDGGFGPRGRFSRGRGVPREAAVRGAQVTQKGTATTAADHSATARTALELQLQTVVLTVALHNIGQPERAAVFFQQSLLENPAAPAAPAPTPGPTPKP